MIGFRKMLFTILQCICLVVYGRGDSFPMTIENNTYNHRVLVVKNQLLSKQLNKENTTYIIQDDFNLKEEGGDGIISIPKGSTLQFEGGCLRNGTVLFNKTYVVNPSFEKVKFDGIITNKSVSAQGMGMDNSGKDDNSEVLENLLNILPLSGTELQLESGTYNIGKRIVLPNIQAPFYLTGRGLDKTCFVATNRDAGITFTNLLRSDIKYISFEAGNYGREIPFINIDNGTGIAHMSTFWKCQFKGDKAFYIKYSAYFRFDECTFKNYLSRRDTDEYLCKINGEYFYLRNCYFEDTAYSGSGSPSMLELQAIHGTVENCDFCGAINEYAIKLNTGCRCISIDKCVFMENSNLFLIDQTQAVSNIYVNADVYDGNKSKTLDTFIVTQSSGNGITWNLDFTFKVYGTFKTNNEFKGDVVPYLSRNSKVKFIMDPNSSSTYPYFPIPEDNTNIFFEYPFSEYAEMKIDDTTHKGELVLLQKSPFNDFTCPEIMGTKHLGHSKASNFSIANTFGGQLKIVFDCEGKATKFRYKLKYK